MRGSSSAGGTRSPGREIARPDPLRPRHPGRGKQRALARQEHDLVHSGVPRPGRAGQRDRPEPAGIAGQRRAERVRDDMLALGRGAQMIGNRVPADGLGRLPGRRHRGEQKRVGGGGHAPL